MEGTTKKITAALVLTLAFSLFAGGMVLATNPPIRYYGILTITGNAAADGYNVSVWNSTTLLTSAITPATGASGTGYYALQIDESHSGESLTFKVGEENATSPVPGATTAGVPGSSTALNLRLLKNSSVSANPSTRIVIKNTAGSYALNITNVGGSMDAFNITVNTTNTTIWNYTLSSSNFSLAANASSLVNFTLIPLDGATAGNYTVKVNVSVYKPSLAETLYTLLYLNADVVENKTTTNSTNFTANQTTTINMTNDTSVIINVTTNTTVTGGTVSVTQTSSNPTNASIDDTAGGKYVNVTGSTNVTGNITYILLMIFYTDEELAYLGITNESTLTMYWYNESANDWITLYAGMLDGNGVQWVMGTGVNTTANYIWANLTHMSLYTYGGKKANGMTCTTGTQCYSGLCGYDYDDAGVWCVASTYCAHDGTSTTGSCGSSYRCPAAGGNWSYCSTGCSSNACITTGGGSSGTGGSGGGGATKQLSILLDRTTLEIPEGNSVSVTATVENKGSATESAVSVTASGAGDATVTITPSTVSIESKKTAAFTIKITVPDGAVTGERTLTIKADANGTTASATLAVMVKKKEITTPSLETAARDALAKAEAAVTNVDSQLSYYNQQGWKTTDAAASLADAKGLLAKAKQAMEGADYATAKGLGDQATDKAGAALKMIVKPIEESKDSTLIFVVLGIALVAIMVAVVHSRHHKHRHHHDHHIPLVH